MLEKARIGGRKLVIMETYAAGAARARVAVTGAAVAGAGRHLGRSSVIELFVNGCNGSSDCRIERLMMVGRAGEMVSRRGIYNPPGGGQTSSVGWIS